MIHNFIIKNNNVDINIVTLDEEPIISRESSVLIHIHGLGGHFQSVFDCMDSFINRAKTFNNYISYGLELRGHGLSSGTRFALYDFNDYIADLHCLVQYIKEQNPRHIYILGESMGGAVACKYSIVYPDIITGIILLSPMCGLANTLLKPWYTIATLKVLSYIIPFYQMYSTNNLKEAEYYDKYLESIMTCKYRNHGYIRLDTIRECYNAMVWLQENSNLLTIPVLALHSNNDTVTSCMITKNFIDNCSSTDKRFIPLANGKHNLLCPIIENDKNPNTVIEIIKDWLSRFL